MVVYTCVCCKFETNHKNKYERHLSTKKHIDTSIVEDDRYKALDEKYKTLEEKYEHSDQARAPHTNGPRDVPRCGALSLLQKTPHYRAGRGGEELVLNPFVVEG